MRPGERADRRESWGGLGAFAADGPARRVRVEGEVRSAVSDPKGAWQLVLQRWAPAEFGSEVVTEVDTLADERCSVRVMKALRKIEGVIHVEADHEGDRVRIWTRGESPEADALRVVIESLGFRVTHIQTRGDGPKDGP